MTHTGALAGSDAVYDAAFRRAGLLRVLDLDELFAAAETLGHLTTLSGKRLAILTNGGGVGVLAVDRLADFAGELADISADTMKKLDAALPAIWSRANPVDIAGDADAARYAVALEQLLDDDANDAVLVMNVPTALASPADAAKSVIAVTQQHRQKSARRQAGLRGVDRRQRSGGGRVRCRGHSELRHRIGCGRGLHASRALPRTARPLDGDAAELAAGHCARQRRGAADHRGGAARQAHVARSGRDDGRFLGLWDCGDAGRAGARCR